MSVHRPDYIRRHHDRWIAARLCATAGCRPGHDGRVSGRCLLDSDSRKSEITTVRSQTTVGQVLKKTEPLLFITMNRQQLLALCLCTGLIIFEGTTTVGLLPVYALRLGADPATTGAFLAVAFLTLTVGNLR